MNVRGLVAAGVGGVLFIACALRAASQQEASPTNRDAPLARSESTAATISVLEVVGLRRISPGAVTAQISSRAGERFDLRRVESDVKALGRLGWFSDIRVETEPAPEPGPLTRGTGRYTRLVFVVKELPFLTKIDCSGSQLLSAGQIERLLAEKQVTPKLGEPAAPENLARAARVIRGALAELGHPQAQVSVEPEKTASGTVRVRFVIHDGPHIPVGRVEFEGQTGVSEKLLQREMHRTAPSALFGSWRGKGAFTREGFEGDRARILAYCQNHGFPEARIGNARTEVHEKNSSRWLLWKRGKPAKRLSVIVPMEAGPFYRVESVNIEHDLIQVSGKRGAKLLAFSQTQPGGAYSAKAVEDLRHAWATAIQPKRPPQGGGTARTVEASREFDPRAHRVYVRIDFSDAPPYMVRRIAFLGLHRFSDRYMRRRIGLEEGRPFDEHALEAGLARLARTGYFHQIKKEDIQVRTDDVTRTAEVTIRVSEAGQQRALFSGEQGQFGSTLGVAYSLFDLLQREEMLSARIDAGPESLQVALGLLMESFLGSRSSLAFSIFNNILRPRLTSSVKGPFYSSLSEGLNSSWGYTLTESDSVAVNYTRSRTKTEYALALPAPLTNTLGSSVTAQTTSSAVGVGWTHDTGSERISAANSVSGGWLDGTENVLRSSEEYAQIFADPVFHRQNAWAFRTTFSGAGSYSGDMPLYARLFSGDAEVRGFSPGELGPYAIVPSASASSGNQTYTALPAGANVVTAANVEYRFPLTNTLHGAGFFDLGSGWMLPNWLGPTRPTLLDSTNGVLHGSLGFELRWTMPGLEVPVRAYLAVNVMRLNRFLALPDGTLFHAHNRLLAFGWALGNLF
ncbi:MAG TPA: POTRA domain-containing protein [Candidatus Methylomirabilis sp.]|nr:POTRA domain-containing protein [Candidatus Methylomirabilis sp.]